MNRIEDTILKNLLNSDSNYPDKVLPYLSIDYFSNNAEKIILKVINNYYQKYNTTPLLSEISTIINSKKIDENTYKQINEKLKLIEDITFSTNIDWLVDETEKFCQDRALYNAVTESISIYSGDSKKEAGVIPELIQDALSINFNKSLGHHFIKDREIRWEEYHIDDKHYEFDIDILNKITKGGVYPKTITVFVAQPGTGKTLILCHLAANYLKQGLNVLYFSLEMSEKRISERIDENILNFTKDELSEVSKEKYLDKFGKIINDSTGEIVIKEYPTGTAHKGHFVNFIKELKLKQKFIPDVIMVDYINICASMSNNSADKYDRIKSIIEELRSIAVEYNVPLFTATQVSKSNFNNIDLDMSSVSESGGISFTADLMIGVAANDDLKKMHQLLFLQLKNRYNDANYYNKFTVGVDYSHMKLFDVNSSENKENAEDSNQNIILEQNNDNINELFGGFNVD